MYYRDCLALIHIAHIVLNFDVGGLENGVVNILNRLPSSRYRHSIICLTGYNPIFFDRIDQAKVQIYRLDKRPGKDLGYLVKLWRLLKQLRPDIVHTRNLCTLECQLAAWFGGIKHRIHGEHGWDSEAAKGDSKPANIRKLFSPLVSHYITLSREGEKYLIDKTHIQVQRISRICNGVDVDKFCPDQRTQSPKMLTIGTVGRLAEVKNQQLLIRAFARLLALNVSTPSALALVIIGEGSCRNELQSLIDELGLNEHCTLAGNRHDIPQAMQELDIYVQSSKAEGISNTILEAMASGLPIISTDVGGARELVNDQLNGIIIGNNDESQLVNALNLYVNTPEIRLLHGRASRELSEQAFSLDSMTQQYDRVYQMFSPQLSPQKL
ncbi:MAG: sugar transferase (PEP-CTERM/EpsH1 system associated) [Motiliproteus sp.]|jgi:sugar transferase (PEP-CTERM/EpsH1 system associated)